MNFHLASSKHNSSDFAADVHSERKAIVIGHFRWVICALLLFGTTKNYMDRQVIGILKNSLQHQFGWNEIDYGNLVLAFQAAYALGMVLVGRLIDRLGTRVGYALAGPWHDELTERIPGCAVCFRFRRGRRFPGQLESGGGVVPQKRAGAGNWHL